MSGEVTVVKPHLCSGGDKCPIHPEISHKKELPAFIEADGQIYPPTCVEHKIISAKEMNPRESDVFVCTFPKSGTTWLQHIVVQLMYRDRLTLGEGKELFTISPMIESAGAEIIDALPSPRILKSHFLYGNIPKAHNGAKYIYCARNPKDCLVSLFHHLRNFKQYNFQDGDLQVLFDMFVSGRLYYGDYFEHIVKWTENKAGLNILFLKYEDMIKDLEGSIKKIGEFLGGDAAAVVEDSQSLSEIVANSRFAAMKEDQGRWFPKDLMHQPVFVRKGTTRDWKNHLTKEQSELIDQIFAEKCNGFRVNNWWTEEMRWE